MRTCIALLSLSLLSSGAIANDLASLRLMDTTGTVHNLGKSRSTKAIAIVFLKPDCPICQRYAPTLNRLAEARGPNVEFYGVVSGTNVSRAEAVAYAADYKLAFPVLFDGSSELAKRLKPSHNPEAFVFAPTGEVVYRGRIDDWYLSPGKSRSVVTEHNLKDAIAALVAGKPIEHTSTKPVGCIVEDKPAADKKVTFNRHIAPIVFSQCATCHRPGEVAPFSLLSYTDAAKRAKQIAAVVGDRTMPPWKAEPNYGHFRDEKLLGASEIRLIQAWAAAGAPEGDAQDKLAPPKFPEGWQLGKPDLIIKMTEAFHVPADGPDIQQNFVIPIDVVSDKMVGTIEFRPGNRRIVHHAICYLDSNKAARKLDDAYPGPGYSMKQIGLGFFPTGGLGGWAPGSIPRFLPEGMGRYLAKGSDAVLQIHYHPNGKAEADQSEVGVYFVRKPALKPVGGISLENWAIDIPPGEKNYFRTGEFTLTSDATFVGVAPHMHLLGKEMKAWAELPDGKTVPLVHVKKWDFNWQDYYLYREPLNLPKGTKLKLEATFDNSADNPSNPNKPPKRITWGEGTADEMALCIFEVTCPTVPDLLKLIMDDLANRKIFERVAASGASGRK